jgi:hypothetical protein
MRTAITVEEMIMNLPKDEQLIVTRLRSLIMECLPLAIEKPYYGLGVPYYSQHRQICYIFPASALYGCSQVANQSQTNKKVTLGFCQGNRMSNEEGVLQVEGRKQVHVMYINSLRDINEAQVRALLFEASMIDDSFGARKKIIRKRA